jgi:hypothetical protein
MVMLGRRFAEEKVATFLIGCDRLSQLSDPSATVPLPMSRLDIADYLGLTIETVSRTFTRLEREAVTSCRAACACAIRPAPRPWPQPDLARLGTKIRLAGRGSRGRTGRAIRTGEQATTKDRAMTDDHDNVIRFPHCARRGDDLDAELAKLEAQLGTSRMRYYKLNGYTPIRVATLNAWVVEVARHDHITAETGIDPWRVDVTKIGDVVISTVFLGLDYRMSRRELPLLFETRVFGSLDHFQNRCATWDKAKAMHAEAVALVRGEQAPKFR